VGKKEGKIMTSILFQGDSLTDAGRDREGKENNLRFGDGYVNYVAANLMCDYPGIRITNTAIAGNRITDLYGRWIEDTLNIDFDILSLLCGVNDIGYALRLKQGADAEKFEFVYDRMLHEVRNAKPQAKFVLCEPFLFKLNINEVKGGQDIIEKWDIWNGHMQERRAIVKSLAEKYEAVFVPFGQMFEKACEIAPARHWSSDGIHLTMAGNALMAREWLSCVKGDPNVSI
jgi:lysophospholipase L1-like esterase